MKKLKILLLILPLITFSCLVDDDAQSLEEEFKSTPYTVGFDKASDFVTAVTDGSLLKYQIFINLIGGENFSNTPEQNITFEVDPSSTAVAGSQYDFVSSNNSVIIDANREFAVIDVDIYTENLNTDNADTLIINLTSTSNGEIAEQFRTISLNLQGLCFSDLAGLYSVTTTYGYHDFLPSYNPNTMDIEIIRIDDSTYEVFDFSGGLYSSGPYADAYGTGDTSFTVQFSDVCDTITWSEQTDPWGTCIPQEGGINAVNPETGVITISWFCNGYGENGVSVYTPID